MQNFKKNRRWRFRAPVVPGKEKTFFFHFRTDPIFRLGKLPKFAFNRSSAYFSAEPPIPQEKDIGGTENSKEKKKIFPRKVTILQFEAINSTSELLSREKPLIFFCLNSYYWK